MVYSIYPIITHLNSNTKARNPKQIRKTKKEKQNTHQVHLGEANRVCRFGLWNFEIVSNFEIRISDFILR